jgi:3-oxoacyl-[acyl-carrier-protein] synthase II
VLSYASAHEPCLPNQQFRGTAIRKVLTECLARAGMQPDDLSHVNAHGLSTVDDDRYEAQAIRAVLGDVPVTAPKSYFGHLGAGGGAVELVASLMALEDGEIPLTLNYEQPDVECPINIVQGEPLRQPFQSRTRGALKLSTSRLGHAAALLVSRE